MSDKTRYEKELAEALKKLPLPSEDAAWDDMGKLLDEEHGKVVVSPPPLPLSRSNIVMGSVIAALLISALLLFICNKKSTKLINDQTNKSTEVSNSKSGDKVPFSNSNDQKELNNAADQTTINTNTPANVSSGSKNANVPTSQPTTVGNHDNIEQITGNAQTNTDSKNNTTVPSVTSINTNGNNLNNNNIQGNQTNNKETVSPNKEINNNNAAPNKNTEADKNGVNRTGNVNDVNESVSSKNTSKNVTSTSIATASVVSLSSKHKTNRVTAIRSGAKTTASIKPATTTNDDTIAADKSATITDRPVAATDQSATNTAASKNPTAVKSNSTVKHIVKHTATGLPYHEQSTVAIATSSKSNKRGYHKKGNIAASTKANTQAKITSANVEENDAIIDTTEMIKIGQSVVANKKAKHPPVIKKDTSTVKPLVAAVKDSSNKKKEKQLRIAVGIAEQQAIRLNCDCVYPNDAYTKSSLVTDYIPSVYVRIQPAKKWFVEAELKYKAPQYIQEQLYKTSVSDLPLNYTTSSYVLKKVYYNQIPISFNYYIIPHLSIGAGIIYNNFAGQTTQQDVAKKLYGAAGNSDSIISSSTISNRSNDSSVTFTKNSFQALVQSQYDWRRWSIGVRYAIGLQPYVKYNDPISESAIQKTSNALTVFIRFELWDSKKKKKK